MTPRQRGLPVWRIRELSGGFRRSIPGLMQDQALKKRLAEADAVPCPSCGRDAVATVTGLCIHCLKPLEHQASHVEPAKILTLVEFERARGRVRGAGGRRRMRMAGAFAMGAAAALVLILLFDFCLRWLTSFFARGLVRT